jgi:tetratricopeptide (TPR) repeat protein
LSKLVRIPYRERFVIFPMEGNVDAHLLRWISRNTNKRSVIMASHYHSPQLLTYTGRPTNLNDFFESSRLRRKAERFLVLLYSSEEKLYEFCREQQSDYLLVSVSVGCDPTDDSPLYQAGFREMPPGCAAYRLIFDPDRSRHFELVYENEMYRLFRVGRSGAARKWPRSPLFYDSELLWKQDGDIRAFYYTAMRLYALTSRGIRLAKQGRREEAERVLSEVLRTHYFYPAWETLVRIGSRRRGARERESLAELAYSKDPNRVDVCLELARARIDQGKLEEAREPLERCAELDLSSSQRVELERLLERIDQNP